MAKRMFIQKLTIEYVLWFIVLASWPVINEMISALVTHRAAHLSFSMESRIGGCLFNSLVVLAFGRLIQMVSRRWAPAS